MVNGMQNEDGSAAGEHTGGVPFLPTSPTRRGFLGAMLGTGAAGITGWAPGLAQAVEPFARKGKARMHLGLAAYSFRSHFGWMRDKPQKPAGDKEMTMEGFIDYCGELGAAAELTSYFFPGDAGDEYWAQIRRHAFLAGVPVVGTALGNSFTDQPGAARDKQIADVKAWTDKAALFGAPHIRVFAGSAAKGQHAAEAQRLCIEALEECGAYAGKRGIFLGIENHGGIVAEADALVEIVKAVQSPWVGINLDTGNFHSADPYGDLEKCAPWAVNVQVKIEVKPKDGKAEEADFGRIAKMLRDVGYQGYVVLEYEADDPWGEVPGYLERLAEVI